jgi:hypothetical protein
MVVPVRRVFVKRSAQQPTTRNGMVARFVIGDLEGVEKGREAESTQKEEKRGHWR